MAPRARKKVQPLIKINETAQEEPREEQISSPPQKKRRGKVPKGSARKNNKPSHNNEIFEIERILSYRLANDKNKIILEFLVKWQNFSREHNSWEPLDNLRYNVVFQDFIHAKFREFETEIFVSIANIKEKLKFKIRKTMRENLKFVILLEQTMPFDPFEYKVYQVFNHLMSDASEKYVDFLEDQVFRNYFFKLEEVQRVKHDNLAAIISEKEQIKFSIENDIDFEHIPEFNYITKNFFVDDLNQTMIEPTSNEGKGCKCGKGKCSASSECCPQLVNELFPYRQNNKGQLIVKLIRQEAIIECSKNCSCGIECMNRVTQQPRSLSLCLFKTEGRGYGLKTLKRIKKGAYILEYVGELLGWAEASKRETNSYLFDLNMERKSSGYYTIDAYKYGNLARFVNHSCEANSSMWFINDCMRDPKNQKLCIFALRDILEDEEITIDYCPHEKVPTSDGINYSQSFDIECFCGSSKCRGSIY